MTVYGIGSTNTSFKSERKKVLFFESQATVPLRESTSACIKIVAIVRKVRNSAKREAETIIDAEESWSLNEIKYDKSGYSATRSGSTATETQNDGDVMRNGVQGENFL